MRFANEQQLYDTIGFNIKKYRQIKKLTQEQLCNKATLSISYLSKLEAPNCHKSISLSSLNEIANVLDTDLALFFKE